MNWKGFSGTRGVHTNLARLGCVRRASSIRVVLFTAKIPWSEKCKCLLKLMVRPSNKSNVIRGTKAPSK